MSWIRTFDDSLDRDVDLFYSVEHKDQAVYLDEIRGRERAEPVLRADLVWAPTRTATNWCSHTEVSSASASRRCYVRGPPRMNKGIGDDLHRDGIPDSQVVGSSSAHARALWTSSWASDRLSRQARCRGSMLMLWPWLPLW